MTVRTIQRVNGPIEATVSLPGSKSGTIRALACAAMAEGRSHLYGALHAEDTVAMVGGLLALGVAVQTDHEPWIVDGTGGHLIAPKEPVVVGESGLSARILTVMATLAEGVTTIDGIGRLRQRPMAGLVKALIDQGVVITTTSDGLPLTVTGQGGLWGDAIDVDCGESSQFATALLLGAPMASRSVAIKIVGLEGSSGYLEVTEDVMEAFGANPVRTFTGYDVANSGYMPADYVVERDASAAVYPIVAAAISRGRVSIPGLSLASKQPDVAIALHLREMGCVVHDDDGLILDASDVALEAIDVDLSGSPDGALALAVACLFATGESRLRGLSSLRHKESDRLRAMSEEMARLGGDVSVESEGLIIRPRPLHGATIDSHGDHRVAMSLALIGTMVEGVAVETPSVVNKTWPGFWDELQSWSAH